MRAVAEFTHEIEHCLNLSIDIKWIRPWVGNDPDGQILGRLMGAHQGLAYWATASRVKQKCHEL
jgi:hypothetical protein